MLGKARSFAAYILDNKHGGPAESGGTHSRTIKELEVKEVGAKRVPLNVGGVPYWH